MAVNLSPIWGAGAQLLDNSGNVLSGGKIYTYAAGTTTLVATYTSSSGVTANSNPIVLNAAGRVPYEIWLLDGQNYKFVLTDSNDTLIGTWDNLSGINSNFIAYTNQQEIQIATAGQTVFGLTTMQYLPGTNSLSVFVDGVNQYGPGAQYAYIETSPTEITFASGLHVGAEVKFTTSQIQNSGVADASQISYTYPAVDAITQNVEDRLAQYVSVKDFGAVGDGVTDDTSKIQNAVDALGDGFVLDGLGLTYVVTSVKLQSNMTLQNFNFITKANSLPADFASPVTIGAYNDQTLYENINIVNVHVNGNRVNNNTGSYGYDEDGGKHGFRFIGNINNLNVTNCSAMYCGSYGFFCYEGIGTRSGSTANNAPLQSNIRITNCVSQWNKAQGSAFSSVTDLVIQNCTFTYNGLDYQTDPGAKQGSNYFANGIDFEGYSIGSWFGNISVFNCDLRYNAANSLTIQDSTVQTTSGFTLRDNINIVSCLMDTGTATPRANPDFAVIVTVPFANWGLGRAFSNVSLKNCSISGKLQITNVTNFYTDSYQYDLPATSLGDIAYMSGSAFVASGYWFNDLFGAFLSTSSLYVGEIIANDVTLTGKISQTFNPGGITPNLYCYNTHNASSGDVVGTLALGSNGSNTSTYFLQCNIEGVSNKLYIYGNGNVVNANNSYGTLSDAKLKSNITSANSQWTDVKALANVMSKFVLNDDETKTVQLGWVAQDAKKVSPGIVFETKDTDKDGNDLGTTTLGVNTSIAMLKAFKALGEALERIEVLEQQINNSKA